MNTYIVTYRVTHRVKVEALDPGHAQMKVEAGYQTEALEPPAISVRTVEEVG